MAATAAFASTPKLGFGQATTANTNKDGTGSLATLLTAGSSGAYLKKLTVAALTTTTTGILRLFISTDGGSTKKMFKEYAVTAATPSATVLGFSTTDTLNMVIPASAIVYMATEKTETFNCHIEYGDY